MVQIPFEAILFDNAGVLVDSHVLVDVAWRQLAREFDLDYGVLEKQLIGVPAADTLGRHLDGEQLTQAIARLEDLEVEVAFDTPPMPGAIELTSSLPDNAWAVATSATRRLANARWAGAGITPPPATITADDITHGKPHPEPFLNAARLLSIDPERCIVLEDSPSGGIAANKSGATVIAVGDQEWTVAPTARVPDLTSLSVITSDDGSLVLHIED